MKLHKIDNYTVTTTVGEMVAELMKFDQSAYVFTEGCDCTGNVVSVMLCSDGTVLIERDGWVVKQAGIFEWPADDKTMDADWQEVAFIKSWAREGSNAELKGGL